MSGIIGNTFDKKSFEYGHARKVWRSISSVYPGGGVIQNVSDFSEKGKIPSGSPVKFDMKTHQITVIKDDEIKAAEAEAVAALGINGYLQEDVYITSKDTVATGTVVYAGEIYEYMFEDEVVKKLKLANVPMIVWVQ